MVGFLVTYFMLSSQTASNASNIILGKILAFWTVLYIFQDF